jgi:GDP-L-fucose synthase
MIEANVVHEAWRAGVEQLLFLGSSCIYPKFAAQPMKEEALLTGVLEPTNEPYAVAKIAGIKMCTAYNRQYGTNYVSVMPTNVYGPGDNYNLETSHVVAALIRKAHEAKVGGERTLNVWGTGRPRREFIYSDDLADACLFLMEHASAADVGELVNVGTGVDLSIEELARQVAEVVGFKGDLVFDTTKPDGVARKLLDVSKLTALGWRAKTVLDEGLRLAYEDFLAHHAQ